MKPATARAEYLAAYGDQLRTDAESPSAIRIDLLGTLRLVTLAGGRGFITHREFGDVDGLRIATLVGLVLNHFRADPEITGVGWKSRGHNRAPGLSEALLAHGFLPDEPESIVLEALKELGDDVPMPTALESGRISNDRDVRAMSAMAQEAFGAPPRPALPTHPSHARRATTAGNCGSL